MYSSKIYKSGVEVQVDPLILEQLRSPAALKELHKLEKARKVDQEWQKVKEDESDKLLNIEKAAYEKGFRAGEKAGLEVGEDKAGVIIERIQAIYDEISSFKEKYYKDNETEIFKLIMAAAEKVVHEELKINKDVVLNILTDAVKAIVETDNVQIRLNPEDIEYHRDNTPKFLSYLEKAKGFTIFADPELTRGGVLIESNFSEIDARVEAGLSSVEKSVREAIAGESETD